MRYSNRPLPDVAYVPGVTPRAARPVLAIERDRVDPDRLVDDDVFRYGVDLFNHGFAWEAHEAWEALWRVMARDRAERQLVHGLIHAAAAVLKAGAGVDRVVHDFVTSAIEMLERAPIEGVEVERFVAGLRGWADATTGPAPTIVLTR